MKNFANTFTIYKREYKAYFDSVIAYVYIIAFSVFTCGLFMTQFFLYSNCDMRYFFSLMPMLLCLFIPAITMGLWAEDKKSNTYELLLTLPVNVSEITLGKFLASLTFFLTALLMTLPIPVMLMILGNPDIGPIIGGYIGTVLGGSFFLAFGIFVSGNCRDQIVAFILSMIGCFAFYFFGTDYLTSIVDGWIGGLGTFLRQSFGILDHFSHFEKGIIDFRSIIFFTVGATAFLFLNACFVDTRMKRDSLRNKTISVLAITVIIVLTNSLFAATPIGRIDLTESKIYTTSRVTKEILHDLSSSAIVKFYVSPSEKMPTGMKRLKRDVIDKLSEIQLASNGNFRFEVHHLEVADLSDDKEDGALQKKLFKKGIQPFQISSIESDEVGVKLVYAALAIAYKDKDDEVIPRIMPEALGELEYNIISRIFRMSLDQDPLITLIAPFVEEETDPNLMNMLGQLGMQVPKSKMVDNFRLMTALLKFEGYQVERIKLSESEPIPHSTKTLVLIQPEKLSQRQLYEINRFVIEGGSLFVAGQNYLYDYAPSDSGSIELVPKKALNALDQLAGGWGINLSDGILMDENHEVMNMTMSLMGLVPMSSPVKTPVQIIINQDGMNADISITAHLSPLFYIWGNALKISNANLQDPLDMRTLLTASSRSWEVDLKSERLGSRDFSLPENFDKEKKPLAILIEGKFPDDYSGKKIPAWSEDNNSESNDEKEPSESIADLKRDEGKVFIIGNYSMFEDNFFEIESHRNFFLNTIDVLSLDQNLIDLRGKRIISRKIAPVSKSMKLFWKLIITAFLPIVIAVSGSTYLILRKRLKLY